MSIKTDNPDSYVADEKMVKKPSLFVPSKNEIDCAIANIVLIEPEIPQNTGNIARTCAGTGAVLHLVKPLGFSIEDRYLKRAGLDYWEYVKLIVYQNLDEYLSKIEINKMYFATTKGGNVYTHIKYDIGCHLVFGKETAGLPEWLLEKHKDRLVRIPMIQNIRSLNLSSSVAVLLYEVLRQNKFSGLVTKGRYSEDKDGLD